MSEGVSGCRALLLTLQNAASHCNSLVKLDYILCRKNPQLFSLLIYGFSSWTDGFTCCYNWHWLLLTAPQSGACSDCNMHSAPTLLHQCYYQLICPNQSTASPSPLGHFYRKYVYVQKRGAPHPVLWEHYGNSYVQISLEKSLPDPVLWKVTYGTGPIWHGPSPRAVAPVNEN